MSLENLHESFKKGEYLFRKKFFKLFGGAFTVYDKDNNIVFYSKQKAFKLKEDFRIYSDTAMTEELLTIKTPQILDIAAVYHVTDSKNQQQVGSVRRKGLKSIIKDEWVFYNETEEVGKLSEKSWLSAILSRIINLIPQTYIITDKDGTEAAVIKQHFNPFILKYTLTILKNDGPIDVRLIIAAGILLCGIEGRQK